MPQQKHRAFLKWAGGKYSLTDTINKELPKAKTLLEPFVGAGSVFLNTDFEHYLLNDINSDLISLYKLLQTDVEPYIKEARSFFSAEFNDPERYYQIRERFNQSSDAFERSVLFLYMNRHGYNGLCRYNQSGKFNVPFGRYKAPYFPEKELRIFAEKSQKATFTCQPFAEVMSQVEGDVAVYCDPPYAPVSEAAHFTAYAKQGFDLRQQQHLAEVALEINQTRGVFVMISNHNTPFTRDIYQDAKLKKLSVARFISQKRDGRKKVSELFAIYRKPRKLRS